MQPTHYHILEINHGASLEEIRAAYRLLAFVWHPDRYTPESTYWKAAEERMKLINEAFAILYDPVLRPSMTQPSTSNDHLPCPSKVMASKKRRRTLWLMFQCQELG